MENERIKAIHDAAVHLFLQQGYARTQISHIAREVGVSVGTIYHDFAGKQEIMHFVLKCTISPGYLEKDFERPVTDDLFRGLEEEIMQVFRKSAENFSGRLKQGKEAYDFPSLISDQFDFPVLARNYREYREHFFAAMTGYLSLFMEKGMIRPLKNKELTTALIVEQLAWWAMDMRYNSFEEHHISLEDAKEVCMDNLVHAYMQV